MQKWKGTEFQNIFFFLVTTITAYCDWCRRENNNVFEYKSVNVHAVQSLSGSFSYASSENFVNKSVIIMYLSSK